MHSGTTACKTRVSSQIGNKRWNLLLTTRLSQVLYVTKYYHLAHIAVLLCGCLLTVVSPRGWKMDCVQIYDGASSPAASVGPNFNQKMNFKHKSTATLLKEY